MTIRSFAPGALASNRSADTFIAMRRELDDLQRQLATGKKAETFGGLGFERRSSLDFRGRLSAIAGYNEAIGNANFRLKLMSRGVERLDAIHRDTKSAVLAPIFDIGADGRTSAQGLADQRLREALDMLNENVNGRYLFAGRSPEAPPVESYDRIMNGDPAGGLAGLKTLISERTRAELGLGGLGRLALALDPPVAPAPTPDTLRVNGNGPALPFGFEILPTTSSSGNVTTTFTAGPPENVAFKFVGLPSDGDKVSLMVSDKDGVSHEITLTARTTVSPSDRNAFQIGADINATLTGPTGFQAALQKAIQDKATGVLAPRAAMLAANEFFAGSPSSAPARVQPPAPPAGPTDFELATAIDAPGVRTGETLIWYKGDDSGPSARDTAPVRVDTTQVVGTGARANEAAIRSLLAPLAVLAAETFGTTPADKDRFNNLNSRVLSSLTPSLGSATIEEIGNELGLATVALQSAKERHDHTKGVLEEALGNVENADVELIAASILTVQTRLQASYQTTSMLSRLTLVNFL